MNLAAMAGPTLSLQRGLGPVYSTGHVFPPQVPSAVVNEDSMGEEPCDKRNPRREVWQTQQPCALKYIYPQACACDVSIPKCSRNSICHSHAGDI